MARSAFRNSSAGVKGSWYPCSGFPGCHGPLRYKVLAGAPRAGELPVDERRNVGFEGARSRLVRGNQTCDGRFDEGSLV